MGSDGHYCLLGTIGPDRTDLGTSSAVLGPFDLDLHLGNVMFTLFMIIHILRLLILLSRI